MGLYPLASQNKRLFCERSLEAPPKKCVWRCGRFFGLKLSQVLLKINTSNDRSPSQNVDF